VVITVIPVNDPPVATPTPQTTPEDTPIVVCVPFTDQDPGDTHTAVACGGFPANGTLTSGPTVAAGQICFEYTPAPGFNGQDEVCITLCDDGTPQLCTTFQVPITVTPVNDAPVAVNDNGVTPEDAAVTINLLGNDSDPDNNLNPATTQVTSSPANGLVTINPVTGQATYTPNAGFEGQDTFSYVICDAGMPVLCDTADVVITVIPVNDPPVATPTPQTTPEDTPIVVCVPFTDQDPGDTHTAVACGGFPANGTLTSGPTVAAGQICFEYTPAPGFNGQDEVCITLCDDGTPQLCTTFQVPITVTPVNDAPVAVDDSGVTPEDVPVTINLLSNDSDPDNNLNPGTTQIVTSPSNGLVSINPGTGQATYTPNTGFNGQDTFSYVICDGGMPVLCDTADVVITVLPVNDPPVVVDDFGTSPEDTPITITVIGNDSDPDGNIDPSTLVVVGGPFHGTVTVDTVTGSITYTPNPNFTGLDSFSYQVCDNGLPVLCEVATVVINVTPVNDPPVANDNFATTPEDTPVLVNVLNNDSDTEGLNPSSVQIVTGPANGNVNINPTTGQITYTPDPDFTGQDTFSYVVCDNGIPVLCDTADVVITVNPVNDPPVAFNDNATTGENQILTGSVLPNDTDVDGNLDTTSVILISGPTNGTLVLNPDGTYTYTPNPNFVGTDQFTYEVCDTGIPVYCDQAVVVITVVALCPGDLVIDSFLPDTAVICFGGTGTLEVVASSSAGMTNASYEWVGPNGFTQSGNLIQVNHVGVYTVTVTDDAGCTVTGNVDVLLATPVALNPSVSNYTICENTPGPLVHPVGSILGSVFRIYQDNALTTEVPGGPFNMFDFNDPTFAAAAGFSNVINSTTPVLYEYYMVEEFTYAGVTCTSPAVLFSITVNPVPPTPAPLSNSAICAGETLQLTTGNVLGATYNWTGPNGYTSTEQNPYIVNATPAESGTYAVVVTNALGCVSDTGFVTVVVNPGIEIDSITGGGLYCSGDDVTITAFPSTTTNVTYTWFGQNGLVLQNQTGPSITFTSSVPAQSGTYTLVVTNEFGCESAPFSILVNIVPQPVTPAIFANSTVLCEGQTLTISTSPYTGTPVSYEWFFNGQSIGTTNVAQFVVSNTTSANTGQYSVVVTVDGCSSLPSAPIAVTVNAAPVAVAGSNSPVCVGAQIQLDATFNPNWSYQWTGPAGFFSTLRNPVINNATLANAGDYTLVVTNLVTGCQATSFPVVSVVVEPIPATPTVQNNGPVCIGSDYTLFVSADSTAGATYSWYNSVTNALVGTSTAGNGAFTISSSVAGDFAYYVIATSASGCSSSASNITTVRVDAIPFDDAYAGEDDWSCGQSFFTLGAVNPTQGTGIWSQSLTQAQAGVAIVSDVNPSTIVTNLLPGENYFYWTMSNGACTDYSSDTVLIWYETAPIANYDSVYVDQNSGTVIEVLLNDDVTTVDEWVVTILEQPLTGAATVNADGTISYTAGTNVFGFDQFVYQLCSEHCPALCDTAVVIVKVGESVGCDVPNIITPNNDGLNDVFTIHCLNEYPDNELLIFNRWGDQVFNAAPYRNDWGGTFNNNLLPEGTYFYILNLGDGSTPISGYVVIHR
jgi:gliding motility-associated-like protein